MAFALSSMKRLVRRERPTEASASTSQENQIVKTQSNSGESLSSSNKRINLIIAFTALTQAVQFWAYGAGLVAARSIVVSLHDHTQASTQVRPTGSERSKIGGEAAWIAASYPLTNGTFILMAGRLGAIWGHKFTLALGCTWWLIWHLGSGFAPNLVGLCFMRGLAGMGGAFMVPNCVALLGINIPPGRKRNLALGLFGAMAPVGAGFGCMVTGLLVQLTDWKWVWFTLVIVGAVTFSIALWAMPKEIPVDPHGQMDWIGAYLGVAGLILFNFAWNQAPLVGWQEVYVYVLLIVSILHLVLFTLWEARVAKEPILPFDIWKASGFPRMILLISCSFMSLGIFLWYYLLFGLDVRGYSFIETGANYQPLCILGAFAAFLAAWLVPRMPAQYIIALGNGALLVANILLAVTPRKQTWWAMMFPAVALDAFSVDLIFAASQIIASASVGRRNQGVAGSLIGTLQTYGLSTGLGFAGTIETHTNDHGRNLLQGYRSAFYFAAGLAAVGVVGSLVFLRMPKNTQEGWEEENSDETETRKPLSMEEAGGHPSMRTDHVLSGDFAS